MREVGGERAEKDGLEERRREKNGAERSWMVE